MTRRGRPPKALDEVLTMLDVAKEIGEEGPTREATKRRMSRMLRSLERRAHERFLHLEKDNLVITRGGLRRLLKHRRQVEEEKDEQTREFAAEMQLLKKRQNAMAAWVRKELSDIRSALPTVTDRDGS
jgi:hypothetical protein